MLWSVLTAIALAATVPTTDALMALPTHEARKAPLKATLNDPTATGEQTARVASAIAVLNQLEADGRRDPDELRAFLTLALSPEPAQRELAWITAQNHAKLPAADPAVKATPTAPTVTQLLPSQPVVTSAPPVVTVATPATPAPMPKALRTYSDRRLEVHNFTVVSGNLYRAYPGRTWCVGDRTVECLPVLEFAEVSGDTGLPARRRDGINQWNVAFGASLGLSFAAVTGVTYALSPNDDQRVGISIASGATFASWALVIPIYNHLTKNKVERWYTQREAGERIEIANDRLRDELDLTEADTLSIDTR